MTTIYLIDKDDCINVVDEVYIARFWKTDEWLHFFKDNLINGHTSKIVSKYIQTALNELVKYGGYPEDIKYTSEYQYNNDYTEFATKLKSMLDIAKKYPNCVWFTEHASDDECVYHILYEELPYRYPRLKQIKKI